MKIDQHRFHEPMWRLQNLFQHLDTNPFIMTKLLVFSICILLHIGGGGALPTGEGCEYFNITSKTCSKTSCTASLGHVCHVLEPRIQQKNSESRNEGCDDCNDLGARKAVCVKVDGKCFIPMCDNLTWLQAENKCQQTGRDTGWTMTLARNINASIEPHPLGSKNPTCKEFWMDCQCPTEPRIQQKNSESRNEGNAILLIVIVGIIRAVIHVYR